MTKPASMLVRFVLLLVLSVSFCLADAEPTQKNSLKPESDWIKERHYPRPDIKTAHTVSEHLSPENLREMFSKKRESHTRFPSHHDIPIMKPDGDRAHQMPEHPDFGKMTPEQIREFFLKRRSEGHAGGSSFRPDLVPNQHPFPRAVPDVRRMAAAMPGRPASPDAGLFKPDEHLQNRLQQLEDQMNVLKELVKTAETFDATSPSGRPLFEEQIARAKGLHPDLAESIEKVFGRYMAGPGQTEDTPEQPKAEEEAHAEPASP
eukprot:CAMPEP_0196654548 /NCGR_PEP_ID=MMETSP1086-20130531/4259_1 /TAXON_ID=77921 /ORGANISM="Cyanoptyche  gloeocystis , Strain SAG4.97" /LENGTH=261 /DNA_ID=CAMNT_0041986381 /DNA_START=32 /DNA_END=817 /DNA_ORIENTATION=+